VWPANVTPLWGLFEDAMRFQTVENKNWFMKRGIPYRRGYFLHGPPKSGKTHFVKLLARHLGADLHVVDLAAKKLTDEDLISVYQGEQGCQPFSVVLLKNAEKAVQCRSMKNHSLTYTTLLNVLDGPFASNTGVITVISCSDYARFSKDVTSVDALLRPGRVAEQVEMASAPQLKDMFVMMLGTNSSSDDAPYRVLVGRTEREVTRQSEPLRPSQFAQEKNATVLAEARRFDDRWSGCFNPSDPKPNNPTVSFTMADVKNYLGQFFTGQTTWAGEITAQHQAKMQLATTTAHMRETKHRLMENRRAAKAKAAKAEPGALQSLQAELAEKDESAEFFQVRVEQARKLLRELKALSPETADEAPAFARPYKLRTEKEAKVIDTLQGTVDAAAAGTDLEAYFEAQENNGGTDGDGDDDDDDDNRAVRPVGHGFGF
jgi:hypothetical protein